MLLDEIYQLSSELIGETSTQLEKLCQIVKVRLENKLKDGITTEDCHEVFVPAAAAMAASMYSEMKAISDDVSSFSAGNISISRTIECTELKEFLDMSQELLAPYLKDDRFCFRGI